MGKKSDWRGTQRRTYQRIARFYDLLDLPFELRRYCALRPLLFERMSGRILDAGVGTGRNLPFYPPGSEVFGIDLSPAMLLRAERRQSTSQAIVRLFEMDVTKLEFPDQMFDAVTASFLFCTLPEELQAPALEELSRVLKPGGTLRLLDYRRPRGGVRRLLTSLWEPWAKWAFGASFDRYPELYMDRCGLELKSMTFVLDDLIALVEARKRSEIKNGKAHILSSEECH